MLNITLTVTLTLEGPILTKSTSMGGYGIDAVMAKNHDGEYYLPGTLVKGRLLQAWQELHDVVGKGYKALLNIDVPLNDFSNVWLGKKSGNVDDNQPVDPARAKLYFTDFIYERPAKDETPNNNNKSDEDKTLHRIKIDEERGSVKKGALLVMEAPFVVGEEVEFKGSISFTAKDESEADAVKRCLEIGLKWIPNLGSEKTIGFGHLVKVLIEKTSLPITVTGSDTSGKEFIDIFLKPESPFCFSRRRLSNNLFESDDIIPGGAVKGALATTWAGLLGKGGDVKITGGFDNTREELSNNFYKIRFTHAFPVPDDINKHPVVAPFSLVKVKKNEGGKDIDEIYDVVFKKDAVLINGFTSSPAFAIDWKDSSDVEKIFGWENKPDRELRIRTAISRDTRKAKDKALFAYDMVIPKGFKWLGRIDLSQITDVTIREKVEAQLRELLSLGLIGMSKTKISAKVEAAGAKVKRKIESVCAPIDRNGKKYWVITLQTPAILCNPATLDETSIGENLLNNYKDVWSNLSGGTLELSHFFATQSLAGGYYLHKRFQDGKSYRPYLLTDAGSVFVLSAVQDKETGAQKKIDDWLKKGLDFPEWAKKEYGKDDKNNGDHWTNCPYIPENGYGEIAVNIHANYPQGEVKIHVL